MKYRRVYIKGCLYMALNNFSAIDIDLTNPLQIIVGCNGSGKSTLQRELAQLYADAADYHKNGIKIIEVDYHNKEYIVSSDFSLSKPHSFMRDGTELNPSGKITVQKELILQEFGLDDNLVAMILGKVKLTDLGPNKRKEWITRMSDVDMTYALGLHKDVAKETRDIKGALSYLGGRIADTSKLLSDMVDAEGESLLLDDYRTEMTAATKELTDLPVREATAGHDQGRLKAALFKLGQYANNHRIVDKKLLKAKAALSRVPTDLDDATAIYKAVKDEMVSLTALSAQASKEERELEDKLKELSSDVDRDAIHTSITQLPLEIAQLEQSRFFRQPPDQCVSVDWNVARSELLEALSNLPDNTLGLLNRRRLVELREQIDVLNETLGNEQNKVGVVRHRIRQLDAVKSNECPKCNHTWKDGVDPCEHKSLHDIENEHSVKIEALKETRESLHAQRNAIDEYVASLNRLVELKSKYPLQLFITEITKEGHISDGHDHLYRLANEWVDSGLAGLKIHRLSQRLKEETITWELIQRRDGDESQRLDAIRLKNDGWTRRHNELKVVHDALEQYGLLLKEEESVVACLKEGIKEANVAYALEMDYLKIAGLKEVVYKHSQHITINEGKMRELDRIKSVLDDLTVSMTKTESLHDHHRLLTQLLSPTHGIIARSIGGFLNYVTEQMNHILNQVFTYDLNVLPCKFEADGKDLDYRFPLLVGGNPTPSADVKTASDGQAEIIDFAFRLIALRQLGLGDHPIFLDEIGRALDEQHRNNIMSYIKMMVDGNVAKQVFLISHYASNHGSFLQADVCVLNSTNITVPEKSNQHVVFE